MRQPQKNWTKDEIKSVMLNWGKVSINELCLKLNATDKQIYYIVKELRSSGVPMKRLWKSSNIKALIEELRKEGKLPQ